jgi:dUTP pyrophosphatase
MGIKKGLSLNNGTGVIDQDYYNNPDNEGNIGVSLKNNTDETIFIERGTNIVQGIFMNYLVADNCNSEDKRVGGIGSTTV